MKPFAIVRMPDGTEYLIQSLLGKGEDNTKTAKNKGVYTLFLSMTPFKVRGLGNVCPFATAGCSSLCIHESGNALRTGRTRDGILAGRLARRVLYHRQRDKFLEMWHWEMGAGQRNADRHGLPFVMRPNVFSDVDWPRAHPEAIVAYPRCQFYGYTKNPAAYRRFLDGESPPNYYLTFSRSESNEAECLGFLERGGTVAVIFDTPYHYTAIAPLPPTWHGYDVVDGDVSDLRHLDRQGVVVGLRAKGRGRGKEVDGTGFVVRTNRSKVRPMVLEVA